MAGIGFELKKMFEKKGLFASMKAYGYASIVCIGPMILGIALLLGIRIIAGFGGATEGQIEILNNMVTYALLFSLILTNVFSMITTRYVADQLYVNNKNKVMSSFWGSISIMLVLGCILYGIFLFTSQIEFVYKVLNLVLFAELIIVWTEMNYLTAIKDYKGVMYTFVIAMIVAWISAYIFISIGIDPIKALLLAVCISYGAMLFYYYWLLVKYFPGGNSSSMEFLAFFDKYPQLAFVGLFMALGIYGHLIIMWASPAGRQVYGPFYGAPIYDTPALIAFISILVTTINFVTSVEVNFYSKYKACFAMLNDGGSLMDIEQSQRELKSKLYQELSYTFTKQVFVTIVFIIGGTMFIPRLPLGMNEDMLGIYRVLCVGYAFYAIGNCIMLIQLYFADNKGALISTASFMSVSCIVTFLLRGMESKYYGVGLLAGGIVFSFVALYLLWRYLEKLMYYVLSTQPLVIVETNGVFTRISKKLQQRYEKKYPDVLQSEEVDDIEEE